MNDHDRINDESAARLLERFGLRLAGVGRDAADERTLVIYFNHKPSDDELREVHEHLRNCRALVPAAGREPALTDERIAQFLAPWLVTPADDQDRADLIASGAMLNEPAAANGGLPSYPKGVVVGPCVCGSWPGGECLKCSVVPARHASRPGDLVPLANGRSVDLGGRWTMPT